MNYIPDTLYNVKPAQYMQDVCVNELHGIKVNERGFTKCPFGTVDSANKGIFFKESIPQNTQWGRVPQLDPRSLKKIGMEWRN